MNKINILSILKEIKRRNVFRVGIAYVLVAWVLLQGADFFLDMADTPKWVIRALFVLAGLGLPAIILFAWAFEITPTGLRREKEVEPAESITQTTGRKLDRLIMTILVLGLGYFAVDKFVLQTVVTTPGVQALQPASPKVQAPVAPIVDNKTIAVMPFVDLSKEKDQEYLSDGISNELLNLLGRVPELRVTSRSSAYSYKGKTYKIADIGKELGVAHVLEGSVMKSGDRVRITAQLIEVATDSHLWSNSYDRTLDDIFAVQDEIAGKVVSHLKVTLLEEAPTISQTDPEAYAFYLRAKELGRKYTPESLAESNALLQKALEIDPEYVEARFALGTNKRRMASLDLDTETRSFSPAGRSATFSLASNSIGAVRTPTIPAWSSDYRRGDLEAMAESLERALDERPGNPDAMLGAAMLARDLGRLDDAILFARWVVNQDPSKDEAHTNLGHSFLASGQFDDAMASYRYALEMNAERVGAHYNLGVVMLLQGEPNAAMLAFAQESDKEYRLKGTAMTLYTLGQQNEYEQALGQLLDRLGDSWHLDVAEVNAWAGDADGAFEWLAKEMDASGHLVGVTTDRLFVSLHQDPRWEPLLESAGVSEPQLNAIEFSVKPPELGE